MAHPIRDHDSQNASLPNSNPFADPVECLPEGPDGELPSYHLHTRSFSVESAQQTTLPEAIFQPGTGQGTPPQLDSTQGGSDRHPSISESDLHWELDDIQHLCRVSAYDTAFRDHDDSDTAPRDDARRTKPKQPGRSDYQAKRSTAGTSQSKTIE